MSYNNYQGNRKKVAREELKKASTFQVGELFDWTHDPFADISFVALRNWLTNIGGMDPKDADYVKFFEAMDSYIELTSLKAIQYSTEEAKYNLLIASKAKKTTDASNRRPLYELAPRPNAGK